MAHTTFIQKSTGKAVAVRVQGLADDGLMNYWLENLYGRRIGDFYPYAAGPRMEANRLFGYVHSDVMQSGGVCCALPQRGDW